jgi:hypothetical protein
MIQRRSFLTGLAALITAPAIVRAGLLMPVRAMIDDRLTTAMIIDARNTARLFQEGDLIYQNIIIRQWITRAQALEMFPDLRGLSLNSFS